MLLLTSNEMGEEKATVVTPKELSKLIIFHTFNLRRV
jgi:hypothetical protein